MYYIYALIDPRDNLIHYIGFTNLIPTRRLAEDLGERSGSKAQWLTDMLDSAFMPTLMVLQMADGIDQARVRKSWWISTGEMLGWPLTNLAKTADQNSKTARRPAFVTEEETAKEAAPTRTGQMSTQEWYQWTFDHYLPTHPELLQTDSHGKGIGIRQLAEAMAVISRGDSGKFAAMKGVAFKVAKRIREDASQSDTSFSPVHAVDDTAN